MALSERIKSVFRHHAGLPGIYCGKRLKDVPPGSLVLFPLRGSQLNCGLTGMVAFKSKEPRTSGSPLDEIESLISQLRGYTHPKTRGEPRDLIGHYLGGEELAKELQSAILSLKATSSLYRIFQDASTRKRLAEASSALQNIMNREEHEYHERLHLLSPGETEAVIRNITLLKDMIWCLREGILGNVEKIGGLSSLSPGHVPRGAFGLLRNINALLNNLDHLEVRGRDSAGISMIIGIRGDDYLDFERKLEDKQLLHEFSARQNQEFLLNGGIALRRDTGTVFMTLAYKVAAQVGHLGQNVRFLREQIRNDPIFQSLVTVPTMYESSIAHTRWASVGEISEPNCHPVDSIIAQDERGHYPSTRTGTIHVCLNGDIDNYLTLRESFERETKHSIPPEITTDTKIIPLRIQRYYEGGHGIEESFRLAVNDFEGSHAIAMHTDMAPGKIFLAQRGSGQAIFIGFGEEHYITASEIYGLVEETPRYMKMEGEKAHGQIVILDQGSSGGLSGVTAMDYSGTPVELSEATIKETEITARDIDRQNFPHYFLKEISESPGSVEKTVQNKWTVVERGGKRHPLITVDESVIPPVLTGAFLQNRIHNILFIGQGTAGVAACGCAELLRYYLADAGIRIAPLKASEFSGGLLKANLDDTLIVAISQSGTTTDTNTAVDMARALGAHTMAIVNRRDSDITFKVDGVLYTSTGRDIEMSVASTKAYYSQIVAGGILGLKLAQLTAVRDADFILGELQRLLRIPALMKKVLENQGDIARSAHQFAPTKRYWAVVGSGYNKISADEIRIKLSELCYKTISSDVVEDKKHIDLSAEPLILICAAANRGNVINDIIKDTAIFKAHGATTIVIATEGEERFKPSADSLLWVPEIEERFSPILTTLAGHLWGYHAARAIDEESRSLFHFAEEMSSYISASLERGLDIYQTVLDKAFQEKTARFSADFKKSLENRRYTAAMDLKAASDLTLLLKYLSGRLPMSDFELDFGVSGTAPNMLECFSRCIGDAINDMARPIDAIRHQAKTVTVGTSRIWEPVDGLLFEALRKNGFDASNLTNRNVTVLKNLQQVIAQVNGETLYAISNLGYTGEPLDDSRIELVNKRGSSSRLTSRVETDTRLRGTKKIIVRAGNVFIGKGTVDQRSILVIPLLKRGPNIDHLLLLNIGFKDEIELPTIVTALGEKLTHIKNIVEETDIPWHDRYLELLPVEELFGISAEKIAEAIIGSAGTL